MPFQEGIWCEPCKFIPNSSSKPSSPFKELNVGSPHLFFDPLDMRWGQPCIEMPEPSSSKQPPRRPWMMKTFLRERSLALANSVDPSTRRTYSLALNSWLSFVNMHGFSFEPTQDTLSFFVVYMSHHISPRSVKSYLSGIVQLLEPDFPSIREIRSSKFINKIMKGCLKSHSTKGPSLRSGSEDCPRKISTLPFS